MSALSGPFRSGCPSRSARAAPENSPGCPPSGPTPTRSPRPRDTLARTPSRAAPDHRTPTRHGASATYRGATVWAVPVLMCDVGSVLLRTSLDRAVDHWRHADGGPPGLRHPAELLDDALRAFRTGHLTESEYVQHLRSRWGWAGDEEALRRSWDESVEAVHLDVLGFLRDLRDQGWYLVGAACLDPWQERRCRALLHEPGTVFHRVTTSTGTGTLLPDPRFFAAALRGAPAPGARLYADASPEHVARARGAGLNGHLFRDCPGLRAACRCLLTVAL